jgi:NAD-dependent SIR2 family protein deacetylase
MDKLARDDRLMHHFSQNINCIEHLLPDLQAKTLRLHGQVDQIRC